MYNIVAKMYVIIHVFFPGKYHAEAEVNISTSLDSFSLKPKILTSCLGLRT